MGQRGGRVQLKDGISGKPRADHIRRVIAEVDTEIRRGDLALRLLAIVEAMADDPATPRSVRNAMRRAIAEAEAGGDNG